MSRWQGLTLAALAASLGGIGPARAITVIDTPAIPDPGLLHGYGAPEPAVLVKNTDISAIVTFGSVPNSRGMTDRDDDDTADVTVYVSYLVEAETESQPQDLLLPAPPLLLDQ